jgi:hypothetical protein
MASIARKQSDEGSCLLMSLTLYATALDLHLQNNPQGQIPPPPFSNPTSSMLKKPDLKDR